MPANFIKSLMTCHDNNRGFTLTEVIVVMVIVAILATGVVFMFTDPTAKVKAAAFEMRGDLNLARAEAVRRNESILVDFIFSACGQADVDSGVCTEVCSKTDIANFNACYGAGSNQGYVICFDEDGDSICSDEAPTTAELEEKIIKTVIFKDPVKFFAEISGSLPASPTGPTPNSAPDGITLVGNNGITLGELPIPGVDFIYMNPDGTSSHLGSVVLYFPQNGDPTTLTVKGKPYAVVVDSVSTGRVVLQRWRPDLGASGEWSRK